VTVRVPGKVNLHLGIGALRADGFHELTTVFHAVDLCDVITVRPARGLSVSMRGVGADELPTGADNLAWRAAALLARHCGVAPDVGIEIDKSIPVAGGMAGGSADAAGTLCACAELWGVDARLLHPLAVELGSDVAFALCGGTALGTGRGEVLEPITGRGTLHWAFAPAGFGISTPAAYRELDRLRAKDAVPPEGPDLTRLRRAVASGDVAAVASALHNDLQPAAVSLAPSLGAVLRTGRDAGALAGIVSGSGPTCAFLCADAGRAQTVAAGLIESGVQAVTASGPAPGATVLG
jgi:4-diphosphocytidyl-2-C-methyl-D-erythritol kinase